MGVIEVVEDKFEKDKLMEWSGLSKSATLELLLVAS